MVNMVNKVNNFFDFSSCNSKVLLSNYYDGCQDFQGLAEKGRMMKTVDGDKVQPPEPEEPNERNIQVHSVSLSIRQIEERAKARTAILDAILAEKERPAWRHWGLNE
jgi:hypothetical protein